MNRRAVFISIALLLGCRQPADSVLQAQVHKKPAPIPSSVSAERQTPIVKVVHRIFPSVVNIQTEAVIRQREFDRFFGIPLGERAYRTQSVGSGFVWSGDGVIVTNAHVIEGASKIVALFHDGTELDATVVGVDPDSDLAVLRVEARDLPAAPIGTSSDLLIGEPVIAIGNPFGLSGSVTTGVLSATGRSVPTQDRSRTFTDFLQTDASINPGNSGGPLVNIEGKVIGINTAIYADAQNIGFAIPVDRARKVVQDLVEFGEVHPVWLGVGTATLTPEESRRLGFSVSRGALVTRVFGKSPADLAGILPGDVITAVNGAPVESREAFTTLTSTATAGERLTIVVRREDESLQLHVTPVSPPAELGIVLLRDISGVVVEQGRELLDIVEVVNGSRGDSVGLRPGDAVVGVNGQRVKTLAELNDLITRGADRSSIVLSVARGRRVYTLSFPTGN
jgi:serine protease Do